MFTDPARAEPEVSGAVARGTGEIKAPDGDRDVGRRHAVHRDRAGLAGAVVHRDAGEKFHYLARRAVDDRAEFVGRHHIHDTAREPLGVDRDRGAVHLL
jgi:hypothetical protein